MKKNKPTTQTVCLVETQMDDITGQEVAYLTQRLLEKGALDAICIPVLMKKGRPGFLFQVLCLPKNKESFIEFFFDETPTLGVRYSLIKRRILLRCSKKVRTPLGKIRVKERVWKNQREQIPEFEDLASLAKQKGIPLKKIYKIQ